MGQSPHLALPVVIFAGAYFILLIIMYAWMIPQVAVSQAYETYLNTGNPISYLGTLLHNIWETAMVLGVWNVFFIAPILLGLGFIGFELAWPNWW